jgi:hypothetical protein
MTVHFARESETVDAENCLIQSTASKAPIYPSLPGKHDIAGFRIGGNGMGNCFFAYFHAVVMAIEYRQPLISPTWWSIKLGPLLRREFSLRRYGTMFRPHPDEISGIGKIVRLATLWMGRKRIDLRFRKSDTQPSRHGLTVIEAPYDYSFDGLHAYRDVIRQRLLDILQTKVPTPNWGGEPFIAVHIRLGDFIPVQTSSDKITSLVDGLRIPLSWYAGVIQRMRSVFPELPIYIFSDGREHELAELLAIEGVSLRRESSDIADLLKMSEAKILIGSHSTFSRWATFLGNMPSVWLKTDKPNERPAGSMTPAFFLTDNFEVITRKAVGIQ